MRNAETISITLPADLLTRAQAAAQRENRTIGELLGDALRRYLQGGAEWEALLNRARTQGKALGIECEHDVERLSDEYRADKRLPAS